MSILQVQGVTKTYKSDKEEVVVLKDIYINLKEQETLSIVGPSGSGKTTLLGLCAGLDQPTHGDISLAGQSLLKLNEGGKAYLRNQKVGFIFQNFQLLPSLTALENVLVPLELKGIKNGREKARALLAKVGLDHRLQHYPAQLSGGEQQRVAIARAFSNKPVILFADEPTGNLDKETGNKIVQLLFDLNKAEKTTLVIVTHDQELADKTNKILYLKGGLQQDKSIL